MKIMLFSASWCNPCKALKQQLSNQGLTSNIEFIDIDENPELTKQYGIRSVPTTVITNDDGTEQSRISGSNQLAWYQNNAELAK
jgi:thioredoxin 1